jgi:uncharacterized membrane protein YgcG
MRNKTKDWTDVQLIISSVALALSLGFWGLFASREKSGTSPASPAGQPLQPDSSASAVTLLVPGQKIYFGAGASGAQANAFTTGAPTTRQSNRPGGGAGGAGGGAGGGGGSGGGGGAKGGGGAHSGSSH